VWSWCIQHRNNKIGDEMMTYPQHKNHLWTPERMEELIAKEHFPSFEINVKPVVLHNSWYVGSTVQFKITTVNSYHPEQGSLDLTMTHSVPEQVVKTEEDFHDFMLGTYVWFAEHETREWFRVNGKVWRCPHGSNGNSRIQNWSPADTMAKVAAMRPQRGVSDDSYFRVTDF
jgi:hypothetical protein